MQRTISLGYRDITQFTSATSDFDTETISAGLNYDYPITEFQYLGFGVSAQRAELVVTEGGSADQAVDWVRNNGNPEIDMRSNSPSTATATIRSSTNSSAASSTLMS